MISADVERPASLLTARVEDYLALVKFRYHATFCGVIFGALTFTEDVTVSLFLQLAALYVSFNVLLYGGIYTINDIADRRSDAGHPLKRRRPIAAGRIGVRAAVRFAVVMIAGGLASGALLFGPSILACYLMVLVLNGVYSSGARNVRYVDLAFNSLPHVVRFLMGGLLVGRHPPAGHLLSIFLLAVALSCLRRQVERSAPGWQSRRTLQSYVPHELSIVICGCVAAMVVLAVYDGLTSIGFFAALALTGGVLIGGAYWWAFVRHHLTAVWTR